MPTQAIHTCMASHSRYGAAEENATWCWWVPLTRLRGPHAEEEEAAGGGIIASHDDQRLHQLSSIGTPKGRGRTRLVREDRRRACGAVAVRALLVSVSVVAGGGQEANEEEGTLGVW